MRTDSRPANGATKRSAIQTSAASRLRDATTPAARGALAQAVLPEEPKQGRPLSLWEQTWLYQIDRWQRSVLFLDMLRERANNMLAHEEAGMPPLLDFDYETIIDARRFPRPVNYALLRVTGCHGDSTADCTDDKKPPVIIFDPRAGHGPGIGGFKRESEVGMALHEGHPTYFVVFFPMPDARQTLADVLHTLRRFVEVVSERHRGKAPVLYGNCQAGWAVMLLAAGCEGLAGPAVLNGSPLSYWAGQSDVNPMRLAGGLSGGSWLAHLLTDVGNGRLDGAWLVQNFENLNPANTLWDKNYQVFSHIDAERDRFLEFERWWTGYYFLSREEILAIVENLFIGNKLERGLMKICDGCYVDLKRVRNPLVIFASGGDNITPPHQALNWIPTVYPTTADLKAAGQRIVYLLNPHVGHLGIFVSAAVARLEHRAILESIGELEALPPGLYELKIENPTGDPDCRKLQYSVRFEERQVEQIRFPYPEHAFESVYAVSQWNESWYRYIVSPWVTAVANPLSAEMFKWLHPMRTRVLMFSEKLNPAMQLVRIMAPLVEAVRATVDDDNTFVAMEGCSSDLISRSLDSYRCLRDTYYEQMFAYLYARPMK